MPEPRHQLFEAGAGRGGQRPADVSKVMPEVVDLARLAADRLAPFSGLHLTPTNRLHMTTLVVGPADGVSDRQIQQMTHVADERLRDTKPIPGRLGKILYHAEAITLAVTPAEALGPIRAPS